MIIHRKQSAHNRRNRIFHLCHIEFRFSIGTGLVCFIWELQGEILLLRAFTRFKVSLSIQFDRGSTWTSNSFLSFYFIEVCWKLNAFVSRSRYWAVNLFCSRIILVFSRALNRQQKQCPLPSLSLSLTLFYHFSLPGPQSTLEPVPLASTSLLPEVKYSAWMVLLHWICCEFDSCSVIW